MRISDWSSDVCPSDLLGRVEIDAIEVIAGFLSRDRALGGCNGVPEDGAGPGERDGGVARSLQVRIVGDGERLQMVAHAFKVHSVTIFARGDCHVVDCRRLLPKS